MDVGVLVRPTMIDLKKNSAQIRYYDDENEDPDSSSSFLYSSVYQDTEDSGDETAWSSDMHMNFEHFANNFNKIR